MSEGENFRTMMVANPHSAGGSLGRRWDQLGSVLHAHFGPFQHRFTEQAGDAARLTREALGAGFEMIVAVGGDGTVSDVVDGFFRDEQPINPDAVLGVLQYGTGGDFCRSLSLPRKLRHGARALRGRAARPIDVGRIRYTAHDGTARSRHFINVASFGISGLVVDRVNASSKLLGGRLSFALATMSSMRRYRAQTARIWLDTASSDPPPSQNTDLQQIAREGHETPFHVVAVCNGRYFGGGMRVAPHAQLDDGQLDVVVIGPMTTADLLRDGHRVYRGTHLDLPQVQVTRARRIEAAPADTGSGGAILLDVDGEGPGRLPASFEVLPAAIRVKTVESPLT